MFITKQKSLASTQKNIFYRRYKFSDWVISSLQHCVDVKVCLCEFSDIHQCFQNGLPESVIQDTNYYIFVITVNCCFLMDSFCWKKSKMFFVFCVKGWVSVNHTTNLSFSRSFIFQSYTTSENKKNITTMIWYENCNRAHKMYRDW